MNLSTSAIEQSESFGKKPKKTDVVLWLKIFFLRQLLSARNQEVETKVDVVWIIISTIFIIIYYSYVIICSLPSVNA